MKGLLGRIGLSGARFCLSAWIGAAVLFVINGVRQVQHPSFDSTVKNHLALLRFPPYYLCGATLLGVATLGIGCAYGLRSGRTKLTLVLLLVLASGGIMAYDYVRIYSPIDEILEVEAAARPAEFVTLHEQSKQINILHVGLAFLAALLLCSEPRRPE